MRYYHVYTKGLDSDIIFRDDKDYIAGMNIVAITHFKSSVKILAFVLMSNHFHFVIYGNRVSVIQFINIYKKLVSTYIYHRYHETSFLKGLETSCDEIDMTSDALKRIIAYVLDNPVKAGSQSLAVYHLWGSASCYFSPSKLIEGIPLSSYGVRELRRILHSNIVLPSNYIMTARGYISPSSYVDFRMVEQIYGQARSFEYFLSTSASSRQMRKDILMFSDTLIISALEELLGTKYGSSIEELDPDMRRNLLNDMRKHFNTSAKQLSRVTGLPLKCVLDTIG